MQKTQKICLISFDNWHYDQFIIEALNKKNIDAYHIKLGAYKHENLWSRFVNFLSKVFLNKNLKHTKKQEFILSKLAEHGIHDQILVINPDVIDLKYHRLIKQYTKKYIAYLYDSLHRCPVEHLLNDNLFDEVFSFDEADSLKHNFKKINNYIYFDKAEKPSAKPKYKVLTISSFDKRFPIYNTIAYQLAEMKYTFNFIFVSRNITYKKLKYNFKAFFAKPKALLTYKTLDFRSKKIKIKELLQYYTETEIITDIVQNNQTGLSFRVFEAMGMEKKLITDNESITKYSFYDPNNILVIDRNKVEIPSSFIETPYQSIPEAIYNEYTLDTWVNYIFNLEKNIN